MVVSHWTTSSEVQLEKIQCKPKVISNLFNHCMNTVGKDISLQGRERTFDIIKALESKPGSFPGHSKSFCLLVIKPTFKLQILLIIISYFPSESCTCL